MKLSLAEAALGAVAVLEAVPLGVVREHQRPLAAHDLHDHRALDGLAVLVLDDVRGAKVGEGEARGAEDVRGDEGDGHAIGTPVELVDVEVCGSGEFDGCGFVSVCARDGDALNFNAIFADDAGPGFMAASAPAGRVAPST